MRAHTPERGSPAYQKEMAENPHGEFHFRQPRNCTDPPPADIAALDKIIAKVK